jgi:hypothetical protein
VAAASVEVATVIVANVVAVENAEAVVVANAEVAVENAEAAAIAEVAVVKDVAEAAKEAETVGDQHQINKVTGDRLPVTGASPYGTPDT